MLLWILQDQNKFTLFYAFLDLKLDFRTQNGFKYTNKFGLSESLSVYDHTPASPVSHLSSFLSSVLLSLWMLFSLCPSFYSISYFPFQVEESLCFTSWSFSKWTRIVGFVQIVVSLPFGLHAGIFSPFIKYKINIGKRKNFDFRNIFRKTIVDKNIIAYRVIGNISLQWINITDNTFIPPSGK